jgi:methanogenic corrinoid protein MtbC1/DNA-binding XRE family transcriptional regulator
MTTQSRFTANDPSHWQKRYTKALLGGDAEAASRVIDEILAVRRPMSEVYLNVITPTLVQLGAQWCNGSIGIGTQKLATQIVLQQMDRLRSMYVLENRHSVHRILVSCVEGERHFIGARMAADLFLLQGWAVDFLGSDVPSEAIIEMINSRRPQLVALSVTMAQGLDHGHRVIEELAKLSDVPKVILGGQALSQDLSWRNPTVAIRVAHNILDAVQVAGNLLQLDRRKAVLREYLVDFGRRTRELRTKAGWTQEQLAETTRLTRVCIVAVEGGKQNVTMDVVVRIANALGVSPERLLIGAEEAAYDNKGGPV